MNMDKIHEALAIAKNLGAHVGLIEEARSELAAIRQACRILSAEGIEDFVYTVRDRAGPDASFTGNPWEHPRVEAYAKAASLITKIAKESA
jgi:hypothetical protein